MIASNLICKGYKSNFFFGYVDDPNLLTISFLYESLEKSMKKHILYVQVEDNENSILSFDFYQNNGYLYGIDLINFHGEVLAIKEYEKVTIPMIKGLPIFDIEKFQSKYKVYLDDIESQSYIETEIKLYASESCLLISIHKDIPVLGYKIDENIFFNFNINDELVSIELNNLDGKDWDYFRKEKIVMSHCPKA